MSKEKIRVIRSSYPASNGVIDLLYTTFEHCGGCNSTNYYHSAFICNMQCNVSGCKFINCWHWHSNKEISPYNEKRTMFVNSSQATNCIFDNSAKFC